MPYHCGKLIMIGDIETKLRHSGGEVCHVSMNHMVCSRSKTSDARDEELKYRIEVCHVKAHPRCPKLVAIQARKDFRSLRVYKMKDF